jgi:hypothetical protein
VLCIFVFKVSKFVKQPVEVRVENMWQPDEIFLYSYVISCFLQHSYEKNKSIQKGKCKKNPHKRGKIRKNQRKKRKIVCISRNTIDLCTSVIVFHSNLFPWCSKILVIFVSSSNCANTFTRPAIKMSTWNTYLTLLFVTDLCATVIYLVSLLKAPPFSRAKEVLLCNHTHNLSVVRPATVCYLQC